MGTRGLSNWTESGVLNHLLRSSTFSKPSTVAVALLSHPAQDSDDGSSMPEVTGGGYDRVDLGAPADADWNEPNLEGPGGSGVTDNASDITFPKATDDTWGIVSGVALMDNASIGAGQILLHGLLDSAREVKKNDEVKLASGDLEIALS